MIPIPNGPRNEFVVLDESDGILGLVLWERVRDAYLWASVSADARAGLFHPAGEEAVGLAKNTTRIESATGGAAYRVPDGLTRTAISEVKNVARQGLTSQLCDDIAYAQARGLRFDLWVRPTTTITAPLARAAARGLVNIRYIP